MVAEDRNRENKPWFAEDLLQDDYFIISTVRPTKESEEYWNKALQEGRIKPHEHELARFFIDSVQVEAETISNHEIFKLWENIEFENKQNLKKKRGRFPLYISVTAGIASLFALLFFFYTTAPEETSGDYAPSQITNVKMPDTETTDIQLILTDNETLSLEGKETEIVYNDDGIAINNGETESKSVREKTNGQEGYNQLIVPMGKRSMLTFAEGSRIWVNAGTHVIYPATFDKKKREIYVDGEVFLEVSPDKERPFLVKTKQLEVEVTGTSFNVMAYEKDPYQNIVLVSGSVKVHLENKKETLLSPNEMLTLKQGNPEVKKVDIYDHISWKNGVYQYKSERLGVIMTRLARYYGRKIDCSEEASHLKCTGKLDLKDDLLKVLNGIAKTAPIICEYNNDTYTILIRKTDMPME